MRQFDVFVVNLAPTVGSEIRKTRPCVIVSPDEMNEHLRTVQIAPLTTNLHPYPWRVSLTFHGKEGMIALDQLRTMDKRRLVRHAGRASPAVVQRIKAVLHEMLIA